ncbi:MAG: tetratricopeptide repeat protein [Bacteroidia bacterium]|nr:tetratricopeptide repeat protein [Bacteroidia bacterium]MDW8159476.1 tetratricopeptide repeat protein [Bacteroidia bacterium]
MAKKVRTPVLPKQTPATKNFFSPLLFFQEKKQLLDYHHWWRSFPFQLLIIGLLAFVFYVNTLNNEYALDDTMVITENKYTQAGLKGLKDILTKDSFAGSQGDLRILEGGRYRPLALVTFAIEYELFGKNPFWSHLGNTLLFVILCALLLVLLHRHIFPSKPLLAFLAAFLFTIHPIHSEAVANIKSRDEILSLLFLILTLFFTLDWVKLKKQSKLLLSLLFFSLALLSKENGLTFLFILPLAIYVFTPASLTKAFRLSLVFWLIFVGYLLLRILVTGLPTESKPDVLNNPYGLLGFSEKYGTIFYVLQKYIQLLFFPHPLSWDYSYKQIPYIGLLDAKAILAIFINSVLLLHGLYLSYQKKVSGFGIVFYFASIFIVSNIIVNIGGVMGERFLFQGSLGFAIVIASAIGGVINNLPEFRQARVCLVGLILVGILALIKTTTRNAEWKNNQTLFIRDVEASPNSAMANRGCGSAMLNLADSASKRGKISEKHRLAFNAVPYFKRAIAIYPDYFEAKLDLGSAFFMHNQFDSAEYYWNEARKLNPYHPLFLEHDKLLSEWYHEKGYKAGSQEKDLNKAAELLHKAVSYNPENDGAWNSLAIVYGMAGQTEKSLEYIDKALTLKPNNPDYWGTKGVTYFNAKNYEQARRAFQKALEFQPNHPAALQYLQLLEKKK